MKRLILIGNKELSTDISPIINSFDYVFRVNRMNNFGYTGERIDGVFLGIYKDYINIYKGGPHVDKLKTAGQIFMTPLMKRYSSLSDWTKWVTAKQYNNVGLFDFDKHRKNFNHSAVCTSLRVLNHLISEEVWYSNYEIWFCGLDVEGRADLLMSGDPWKNTRHSLRAAAISEENWLLDKLRTGKLKRLGDDGKEIPNTNPC